MANEFIARNGLISQNNSIVTGSLTVTAGITGSFSGNGSQLTGIQRTRQFDYFYNDFLSYFPKIRSFLGFSSKNE